MSNVGCSEYSLLPAADGDMRALMRWFPDAVSTRVWGGPFFRFPFTFDTFIADAPLKDVTCYMTRSTGYNSFR